MFRRNNSASDDKLPGTRTSASSSKGRNKDDHCSLSNALSKVWSSFYPCSAVVFGIRKQIQAQHGMSDIQKKLEELKKKQSKLQNRDIELKSKLDAVEKKNKERAKTDEERRTAELDFLKYQENHLSQFLTTLQEGSGAK